jgi:hypothetical protein
VSDPILVASLVEHYTTTQIREFWKQALDALMQRQVLNIHATSSSRDGSSLSGLTLTTPAEQRAFIATCIAALQQLGETIAAAPNNGTVHVRFDAGCVAS